MKIVILEDEALTARDLEACIRAAEPAAEVVAVLGSVKEAIGYFRTHAAPDLIFSDIQLGDGLSFTVFRDHVPTVPVIFCTAYDEYALEAFKAAGIGYVLKPFTARTIGEALGKYNALRSRWSGLPALASVFAPEAGRRAVLVYYQEKIMPVSLEDIALVYLQDEVLRIVLFNKQQYVVGKKLEELEKMAGPLFFRVNRQFLVNREAIRDVSQDAGRRLLVNLRIPFGEPVMVGRLKTGVFLDWLAGEKR